MITYLHHRYMEKKTRKIIRTASFQIEAVDVGMILDLTILW